MGKDECVKDVKKKDTNKKMFVSILAVSPLEMRSDLETFHFVVLSGANDIYPYNI